MTVATQAHEFAYGGLALTGIDGNGALWTVEAAEGWHGGAVMRTDRQEKAGQDGDWPTTPHRGARVVRLQGKVFAPDLLTLEVCARTLAAAPVTGMLVGSSVFGDLTAFAQIEDAPEFSPISDTQAIWQFSLSTPDPLLYGSPTFAQASLSSTAAGTGRAWPRVWPTDYGVPAGVTPGAVSLSNAGTAGYWPRAQVAGPVPNPVLTLVETGDWVKYTGTVADGQVLDFDFANRRVLLGSSASMENAVSVRQKVTSSGSWLRVPPGGGSVSWTADGADPAALLSVWGYEGAWT